MNRSISRRMHQRALAQPCRFNFQVLDIPFEDIGPFLALKVTINNGWEAIEKEYGGPVWTASIARKAPVKNHYQFVTQFGRISLIAMDSLRGVGDASLGEWNVIRPGSFHITRRCSAEEVENVGELEDLRGTHEGMRIVKRSVPWLKALPRHLLKACKHELESIETGPEPTAA